METSPPSWSCRQHSPCSSRVPSLPQPNSSSNSYNSNSSYNNINSSRSSYNSRNSNWPFTGRIVCLIALLHSHSSWLKPIKSGVKPRHGCLCDGALKRSSAESAALRPCPQAEKWLDGQAVASLPSQGSSQLLSTECCRESRTRPAVALAVGFGSGSKPFLQETEPQSL